MDNLVIFIFFWQIASNGKVYTGWFPVTYPQTIEQLVHSNENTSGATFILHLLLTYSTQLDP